MKKKSKRSASKRKLATIEGVKYDLKKELRMMFEAFNDAITLYGIEISQTAVQHRDRVLEASLLNSKIIQCISERFPNSSGFAKYRRFTLKINGYTILFKKLNKYDKPMNIKTKVVQGISHQLQLPLFGNSEENIQDPILFFGYNKDKIGNISNPKIVYIDEDKVIWKITLDDVSVTKPMGESKTDNKITSPILKIRKRNDGKEKKA